MVKYYYYISVSLFLGNYWIVFLGGYTLDAIKRFEHIYLFIETWFETALRMTRQLQRLFQISKIILKKVKSLALGL